MFDEGSAGLFIPQSFIIFFNNFTSYSTGYCLLNWGRVLPFTKSVSATQKGLVFSPYAFKLSMDFNCLDLTLSKAFLLSSQGLELGQICLFQKRAAQV